MYLVLQLNTSISPLSIKIYAWSIIIVFGNKCSYSNKQHFSLFSLTQLNEMLNEEDKILEMIQKLPSVVKLAEDREKLSNECIAQASKSCKTKLETN